MLNPSSSPFKFVRSEILNQNTGHIKFYGVELLRSVYPYKKGTKFLSLELDVLNAKVILENTKGFHAYPFYFFISRIK